ncbi:hypothetical protein [Aquabacterium sp. CECT 9606]|uniref:hypothetical protein n=1 Tax=Aquabacterium sp. CECT 9606 TaxID=2845822 RepID=UPI001E4F4EEB|nr:hypothetical protein [Aquabacterium sp. CECT 9606]
MAWRTFRVTLPADFRKLRMCVFFDELLFLSGEATLKGLIVEMSMATRGDIQLGAWQARLRGEYLPRQNLIDLLRKKFPGMSFGLHHPAWDLLAHPRMSPRNLRRLLEQMPDQWHRTRSHLRDLPTAEVGVRPSLPDALQLHKLDFLDALLLFWCEREVAIAEKLKERRAALDQILWLLPVLHPLDPLWARAQLYQERHRYMLHAIDCGLGLTGEMNPGKHWDWCAREVMIFDQQWHLQERMRQCPQGLRTVRDRMQYLARVWCWRPQKQPSEQLPT